MWVGSEGSRAASVGVMGMFVQHLSASRGGVFSKIQEVSSTKHLITMCPGHWARCHGRGGNTLKLCARWGCSLGCRA